MGHAVSRTLARRGYHLALLDRSGKLPELRMLADELDVPTMVCEGDFGTGEAWRSVYERVGRELGRMPNAAALLAGGYRGGASLLDEEDVVWDAMLHDNLATARRGLRAVLPSMVSAREGSVVLVGSRAALRPWTSTTASAYAVAKGGVVTMTELVAAEMKPLGVRVNAILPSILDTPQNRRAMPDADPNLWVSLECAAATVAFLLSEEGREISGATIPLDGKL